MDIPYALVLDIFLAVLLVVTIIYAVLLNKRLNTLRRDKKDLQKLALSFGEATIRAEEGTAQLRATIEVLQEKIDKAETLREDLVFLVKRGNDTADALEELVRSSRDDMGIVPGAAIAQPESAPQNLAAAEPVVKKTREGPSLRSAPRVNETERPTTDKMSHAELELLKALRSAG